MEIYLVGGAVRDELLGKPVTDRDWVVVGASAEELLARGYTQVGRDFPVFLHPETHEEYALARTERKRGPGHKGFEVYAGSEVTLEEDLARRDLTINAIARRADGAIVDPFGGVADIERKRLRHVSAAFSEDPLRVLRVARFAAQLPGFTVVPATLDLMQHLTAAGGLAELPAERVSAELTKLLEKQVAIEPFFAVLRAVGGTAAWFKEFASTAPEVPASLDDPDHRYAALCWGLTEEAAAALGARLKISNRRLRLSQQVTRYGALLARWQQADAEMLAAALQAMGAFKDPEWSQQAPQVIAACSGTTLDELALAVEQINRQVTSQRLRARGLNGPALGRALAAERAQALRQAQGQEPVPR